MTNMQSYVTDLIPPQGIANSAAMKSDLEHAIGVMNNYPREQRTLTLLICLMRNIYARSALSELLDMKMS